MDANWTLLFSSSSILKSWLYFAIRSLLDEEKVSALKNFSESIGVAFQIQDDLIEAVGDADMIGKSIESDKSKNKAAYPLLFGVSESKKRVENLYESACDSLKVFGESSSSLMDMAEIIIQRKL